MYFKKSDAIDVRQVTLDNEQVVINGTIQTAPRGSWVVTRRLTFSNEVTIWNDEAFRAQFVQLPDQVV